MTVKQSFLKQLFLTVLCVIMVLCSVFVVYISYNTFSYAVGILGTVFFGACSYFIIKRLIVPKFILSIDEQGFIDNSTAMATGEMVYWKDVENIETANVMGQKFICVKLKHADNFVDNLSSIKKLLINANRSLAYGEIQITLNSANVNYNEVYNTMREYWLANREASETTL